MKYKQILCAALMICATNAAKATDPTDKGWYDDGDKNITITGLKSSTSGICTIEKTYTIDDQTYTVAYLGDGEKMVSVVGLANCPSLIIRANAEIGANAFYGWTNVKTLTMDGVTTPPTIGENALPQNLEKIVVPAGMADVYANATGWSAYAGIIEDANGTKPTAMEEIGTGAEITVKGRTIEVGEAAEIVVTDMAGRRTDYGVTTRCTVGHGGIYIVNVGGATHKIVVR